MAFNLMSAIQAAVPSGVLDRMSGVLGESPQSTHKGFEAASGSILEGLSTRAESETGAARLHSILTERGFASPTGGLQSMTSAAGVEQAMNQGPGLLSSIFGNSQVSSMAESVSDTSGMKSGSAMKLLGFAAPVVLGTLGRHVSSAGLDAGGLRSFLQEQRSFLPFAGREPAKRVKSREEVPVPVEPRHRERAIDHFLLPAIVAVLLVLGALFWARAHRRAPPRQVAIRSRVTQPVQQGAPPPVTTHQNFSPPPGAGGAGPANPPQMGTGVGGAGTAGTPPPR